MSRIIATGIEPDVTVRKGNYRVGLILNIESIVGEVDMPADVMSLFFSPLERSIVESVMRSGGHVAKGGAIGRMIGQADNNRNQATSKVQTIITNLCERGVLENTDDGYRLTVGFEPLSRKLFGTDESAVGR